MPLAVSGALRFEVLFAAVRAVERDCARPAWAGHDSSSSGRPQRPCRECLALLAGRCRSGAAPAPRSRAVRRRSSSGRGPCGRTRSRRRRRRVSVPPRWIWNPSTCWPDVVGDQRALEADVGGLDAGAGVRAAVDVDRHRGVEAGQPPLELVDQAAWRGPWSPRSPACRTRSRCRPSCAGGTCSASPAGPRASSSATRSPVLAGRHVEDDHLLLGGGPHPAAAVAGRPARRWRAGRRR